MSRWAWAEVDLGAIEHNVRTLIDVVAPSRLWAVVKADGYGHGAVPVAHAALRAGAAGLCVALAQEGVALRSAGIDAPILVLSEQPHEELVDAVRHGLICTVYSVDQIDALASAAAAAGRDVPVDVHVKVDTGMRRVGAEPDDVDALVASIERAAPRLRLTGMFTHLPVADEPDDPFTAAQLLRFSELLARLRATGRDLSSVHVANSAGAVAHPLARHSFVRAGIAIYGISPGPGVDHLVASLRPAMSLRARVSHVKRVRAGERISYGLRHTFAADTHVATLPIGYADGVPRRLSSVGGTVLLHGSRHPIVGVVTMDQLMVDVGGTPVAIGDEAVLIGAQGRESIAAAEWAEHLGTIGYEIVCGISQRIERRYV